MDKAKIKLACIKDKKAVILFCAIVGILLILLSSMLEKKQNDISYSNDYGEYTERRIEMVLCELLGDDNVKVLITFENEASPRQEKDSFDVFSSLDKDNSNYSANTLPRARGVMIVIKNTGNVQDLKTIKKAAATLLDINTNQIEIIGGKG